MGQGYAWAGVMGKVWGEYVGGRWYPSGQQQTQSLVVPFPRASHQPSPLHSHPTGPYLCCSPWDLQERRRGEGLVLGEFSPTQGSKGLRTCLSTGHV